MNKIHSSFIKSLLYIFSRFVLGKKFLIGHSRKFGLKMKFKTQDGGGREIYKKSTYEDENSTFLVNHLQLKPGDTVLDVGANIGWYSILLDKNFPDINIFSFEPDPVNIECFQYNVKANNTKNVELVEKAVSDKNGRQIMYVYKNSNKGRNSLLPINNYGTLEINVIKLDDFISEKKIKQVRFMKIDIEGYEYFAFHGAGNVLKGVELLLMEFAPGYMKKGKVEPKDVLLLLENQNFTSYVLQNQRLMPVSFHDLLSRGENIDIYLLKEDQQILDTNLLT